MSDFGILPVGSVVRLASTNAAAMIMGYNPIVGNETSDYLGIPYPMGLVTDDCAVAFDRSAIEEVLFEGYMDEEGQKVFAAMRSYEQATQDMVTQVERFIDSLTPERVEELRERYAPQSMPEGFEIPEGFEFVDFE